MNKLFASVLLFAAIVALPVAALAAEFKVSDKDGAVNVSSNESPRNLYIAGNTVNVSADTQSDLVAAGNTLNLQGSIEDSLIAAGANVNLNGEVGKNARVAGSSINVRNTVGEDLFMAGGSANLSPEAVISGDLYAATGSLTIDGRVAGRVRIAGGDTIVNGSVDGDLVVDGGKLTIGDSAVIGGKLIYKAPQEASIASGAVIRGGVDYQKTDTRSYSQGSKGVLGALGILGFLMSLVILFALVYILPKTSRNLVRETLKSFLPNLGWGFLTFVVVPTALMIIAFTVIGLKLAGILAMIYLLFLMIAFIFATLVIGAQIIKWFDKREYRVDWLTILIGLIVVIILGIIPFLGDLVVWAVALAVLGELVAHTGTYIRSQRR